MGDKVKGLIVLALIAAAGWKGHGWWQGRSVTHQFAFAVEGPQGCEVQLDYAIGEAAHTDRRALPWEGEPGASTGHQTVRLKAVVPASCRWQPEQVRCVVTRDGAPWQDVTAHRQTDPSNGDPNGALCEVERDAVSP